MGIGSKFLDRRIGPRRPLVVRQIPIEVARERFFGYAINLSIDGLYVQTANPKPSGTKVQLRFNLPGDDSVIECSAEVAWSHAYHTDTCPKPGMGVKFLDLRDEDAARIRAFIATDAPEG